MSVGGSGAPTWPDLITALLAGRDLDAASATWVMDQVMAGEAAPIPLAGFLVALRAKGETVEELRGLADGMLEHAHRIEVPGPSMDIVGTGGDRQNTVNISTMAAVVIAATGVRLVKHGNRAASSSSGAADVLEALGVNLTLTPAQVREVALEAGITFCFAQTFHPSFRHAAPARVALGVPTAFNALGPLTNPAQPTYAAVGVADPRLAPLLAGVFAARGKDAILMRGDEGLDELSISTTSRLWWVRQGQATPLTLDPDDVGIQRHPLPSLRGGDAAFNAKVALSVFAGEASAAREAVVLNAGAALALAHGREGALVDAASVTSAIHAGVQQARQALDSGAAQATLQRWVASSQRLGG